jgi:hypothetical protein
MSSRYEEDQEDRYNDVLIVMELLTNLLSKDFIDFGEDGKYIQTNSKYRSILSLCFQYMLSLCFLDFDWP